MTRPTTTRARGIAASAAGIAATFTLLAGAPVVGAAQAQAVCDRFVSPSGDVERLASSLRPGQTGCLRRGTYEGDVVIRRGGSKGKRIVIRSAPGQRATIRGRVWIDGNDVVLAGLRLDGRNDSGHSSPLVTGSRVSLIGNDITNAHTGICVTIGATESPWRKVAYGTRIVRNRIHDCGVLPATNLDHGVYVEASRGARIIGNAIYDNADRGVQLFPDARGTLVTGNVIDGNGEGVNVGGWRGMVSRGNIVTRNVISNSRIRGNVEAWWSSETPPAVGAVVRSNCLVGGRLASRPVPGLILRSNVRASNAIFRNRAADDFRISARTICGRLVRPSPAFRRR